MGKALPPKGKPKKRVSRPLLLLTHNGRIIRRIRGPKGANDLRLVWGIPILGGGGWWTRHGMLMKEGAFLFPPGTNDWHFFVRGIPGKGISLLPPPWANDVELIWRDGRIVEAWWTKDGKRREKIPLEAESGEFHFRVPKE